MPPNNSTLPTKLLVSHFLKSLKRLQNTRHFWKKHENTSEKLSLIILREITTKELLEVKNIRDKIKNPIKS